MELAKQRRQSTWPCRCHSKGKGATLISSFLFVIQFIYHLYLLHFSVGILDGDIFGPSVPLMMNIKETPLVDDDNMIIPPVNFGIKCLSMGLLVEDSSAVVWRGPLVMSALQRLLKGAKWVD